MKRKKRFVLVLSVIFLTSLTSMTSALANEIWVTPGGYGLYFPSGNWPVTLYPWATFAFSVPDNMKAFESAKLVVISGVSSTVTYSLGLSIGSNGDPQNYYTDSATGLKATLTKGHLQEIDISSYIPTGKKPGGFAIQPEDYIGMNFQFNPSYSVNVLGLRFQYEDPVGGSRSYMGGLVSFTPEFRSCSGGLGLPSCQKRSMVSFTPVDGQTVTLNMILLSDLNRDGEPNSLGDIVYLEASKRKGPTSSPIDYRVDINVTKGAPGQTISVSPSNPVYSTAADPTCANFALCPYNMLVKLNSDSLLTIEVDPSVAWVLTMESIGVIMSAKTQYHAGASEQTLESKIWNAGEVKADYVVTVTDCGGIEPVAAQSRTLNPQELAILTFTLRSTSGPISSSNQCTVRLLSTVGRTLDSVVVRW